MLVPKLTQAFCKPLRANNLGILEGIIPKLLSIKELQLFLL